MGEKRPRRIQLSRRKGFRLQDYSEALNGLPCLKVDRSTCRGNPFTVTTKFESGTTVGARFIAVPTVEDAVACFREMFEMPGDRGDAYRAMLAEVRGKNVACWCGLDQPCHGDVWLELANSPSPIAAQETVE